MRRRGRQFLTKFFMLITGGIVASLIVGSVYFLMEPTLSLKRLFVIPLLMIAADLAFKFFTSTTLPTRIGKIAVLMGVPALFAVTVNVTQRLPIKQVVMIPKKLVLAIIDE